MEDMMFEQGSVVGARSWSARLIFGSGKRDSLW